MKKSIIMLVGVCVLVLNSGCATYLNHQRVKENMVKDRIMTSGSLEQKQAVVAGVKPSSVLSIIPTSDAKGAYVALDLLKLGSLPDFWATTKEAPVSTIGSIIIDAGLVGLATYAIQEATKGNSDSRSGSGGEQQNNGDGNSNVSVQTGDNSPVNVTVHNGDDNAAPAE